MWLLREVKFLKFITASSKNLGFIKAEYPLNKFRSCYSFSSRNQNACINNNLNDNGNGSNLFKLRRRRLVDQYQVEQNCRRLSSTTVSICYNKKGANIVNHVSCQILNSNQLKVFPSSKRILFHWNSTKINYSTKHYYSTNIGKIIDAIREVPVKKEAVEMTTMPTSLNDRDAMRAFLEGIDAVMFDCDGVLWLGMNILPNAPELVKKLRALGKKVFFMTNNSTKTREEFLVKFNSLGFETTLDEIVSTSFLAALHLKELDFKKKVYVIGTLGVTQELEAVNIETLPVGPDIMPNVMSWAHGIVEEMPLDPEIGAVVVGFDHHFSYTKLFKAASYLKYPSCIFIATNTDESFPAGEGKVVPGTGSIVCSVKTAAGREPIVMGKPSRIPFDYVQRFHNLDSSRVLMVGDRANTDILFGRNCGLRTLLVLSGVTTLDEVQQWVDSGSESTKDCIPEFYLKDVGEFYQLVENLQ